MTVFVLGGWSKQCAVMSVSACVFGCTHVMHIYFIRIASFV